MDAILVGESAFTGKNIEFSGNKKALLPRRHSYEPTALRLCREAT
jgi:hypothetical protein